MAIVVVVVGIVVVVVGTVTVVVVVGVVTEVVVGTEMFLEENGNRNESERKLKLTQQKNKKFESQTK